MHVSRNKSHKVRKRNTHVNKSRRRNRKRVTVRRKLHGGMPGKTPVKKPKTNSTTQKKTKKTHKKQTLALLVEQTPLYHVNPSGPVEIIHANHLRERIVMTALPNSKFRSRDPSADSLCYSNGPDGVYMKEYDYLERFFNSPDNIREYADAHADFINVRDEILPRQGKVRCQEGIHKAFEFPSPRSRSIEPLELGNRLKIVVVQHKRADDYIVLMTNAYMENYNYAGAHILKWTDADSRGNVTIRKHAKDVELIDPGLLKNIEDWGRVPPRMYTYPPWGMLLGMKTEYPEEYNLIITKYFVENGLIREDQLKDTVFLDTINEISHSAIPYMYDVEQMKTDVHHVPLVFIGAEAVFYEDDYGKLCFVICNLSGHFKTPQSRMQILIRILVRDYGYSEDDLILLYPPPPPPPSSQDSDASEPRKDYRAFVSNVEGMTFQEAAEILRRSKGNNAHPVIGPVDLPLSQLEEPDEFSEDY